MLNVNDYDYRGGTSYGDVLPSREVAEESASEDSDASVVAGY